MSATTADNRRRLNEAIGNMLGMELQPALLQLMVEAYVGHRDRDPDPDHFDQRMNIYLRAVEDLLLMHTGIRDAIHELQVQTMSNMLAVIQQIEFHVIRHTIH